MSEKKINILAELGRRGVYQAVGIYVAVAWGSIEILITASDRLGWPSWLGDAALILFLTALPFVVLLSWAFDLTGSGLKRMEPGSLLGKVTIAAAFTLVLGLSGYWFLLRDAPSHTGVSSSPMGDGRPVIAVMPFRDFLREENSDILVTSFADELINRINAHPDLVALTLATVTSPQLSGNDGGGLPDLPADYFVQGTFRPAPVGSEVQVRLVDRRGLVQWEHSLVRDFSDFRNALNAQAYLAGEVAAALGSSLTGMDYCATSENSEAARLYYQAKERFALRGAENVAGAARMLEQVIELDPGFARAYDLLADVYERFPYHVFPNPSAYGLSPEEMQAFWETRPQQPIVRKALDLCPSLGSSYVLNELLAPVRHYSADLVELTREALRRDPGNTPLRDRVVHVYLMFGHVDDARLLAQDLVLRDPFNPRSHNLMAWVYRMEGDQENALKSMQESVDLGQGSRTGVLGLAYDQFTSGRFLDMSETLGPDFEPSASGIPIDPRLLAALSDNENRSARDELIRQARRSIDENPQAFLNLIGANGGEPWLFELGDESLAWEFIEEFADFAPAGMIPDGFWYSRFRQWFGNQRLVEVMSRYTDEHIVFWDRHGPPDGCDWDGERLSCEWAGKS